MLPIDLEKYRGKKICIAVSGGADSVCLLHAFSEAADRLKITLSALTCEHGIRGERSKNDVRFVENLCEKWHVPLRIFSADIPALSAGSGRGLEEEGRIFRYRCFAKILEEGAADFVATAHHKDDVAETVLYRLARGTSLKGLSAIRERDGIIRPFLNVTRAQIEEYAREHNLDFVTDESNSDERFARNAIRGTVLPALETVVRGAGEHLVQFAERAAEDDHYLQSLAQAALTVRGEELRIAASLPKPVFSRACVIAMNALGIGHDYTQANVEEVFALTRLQSGRRACLPQGAEAAREGEEIVFYHPKNPFGGEIPFGEGEFPMNGHTAVVLQSGGGNVADFDAFPAGCVIRTRREGDRFTPYKGREKALKEYLTDKKISAREGRNLPLVALDEEVYAVFGVEISDSVKVTETTKRRVYLRLK